MTLNKILNITSKEHILNGNKEKKKHFNFKNTRADRQTDTHTKNKCKKDTSKLLTLKSKPL